MHSYIQYAEDWFSKYQSQKFAKLIVAKSARGCYTMKRLWVFILLVQLVASFLLPCRAQTMPDSTLRNDRYLLYYRHDDIAVDSSYLDNAQQMERIRRILTISPRIDSITIYAYSSPEGTPHRNNWLAQKRAEAARDFILATIPHDSVISPNHIYLRPMGENWEGLTAELEANYHLMNRDRVLRIIHADVNTETKKWRLQQLDNGFTYRWIIQYHMPMLRMATWTCIYVPTPELMGDTVPQVVEPEVPAIIEDTATVAPPAVEADTLVPATRRSLTWAIKSNLLYDAALVPNIGAEFYLGHGLSVAGSWNYAWWNTDTWYWRYYGGEIDLRYWLGRAAKEKPLTGHHVGIYAQAFTYDFMIYEHGFLGGEPGKNLFDCPNYAVGVEYGYSKPIARNLHLDFVVGIGYQGGLYNEYYYVDDHYVWHALKRRHYVGPTKAEVSLVWQLGGNSEKGGTR